MASIQKRTTAAGTLQYNVRWRRPDGKVSSRTFRRRADADAFRRQVEHDELRGLRIDPRGGRITLSAWWDLWWPSAVHLKPNTRARDESMYRTRIEPELGALRLDRIDRPTLRSWVVELEAEGLAPTTVAKCSQIVRKLLAAAVEDGRLGVNSADGLKLPRVPHRDTRFLTPAEVATLADAIAPEYRALVLLGAYGGLRVGEMLALRVGRLDLDGGRVQVLETLSDVRGQLVTGDTKTGAGRRTVPIPSVVTAALAELTKRKAAPAYVFTAPAGGPVWPRAFRRRVWLPAVRAAGLDGLRVHDLRHTAVAFWIAAGASPNEVAARAGHRSVVTVLDRYGHLLPSTAADVTDRLEAMASAAAAG